MRAYYPPSVRKSLGYVLASQVAFELVAFSSLALTRSSTIPYSHTINIIQLSSVRETIVSRYRRSISGDDVCT